jgi:hypothetical protein
MAAAALALVMAAPSLLVEPFTVRLLPNKEEEEEEEEEDVEEDEEEEGKEEEESEEAGGFEEAGCARKVSTCSRVIPMSGLVKSSSMT